MKKTSLKTAISTLLILFILSLALTGALLYFGKTGMIWGISRNVLREIHFWVAVVLCVLIVMHLILNRRLYLAGLRRGRKH